MLDPRLHLPCTSEVPLETNWNCGDVEQRCDRNDVVPSKPMHFGTPGMPVADAEQVQVMGDRIVLDRVDGGNIFPEQRNGANAEMRGANRLDRRPQPVLIDVRLELFDRTEAGVRGLVRVRTSKDPTRRDAAVATVHFLCQD